MRGRRQSYAPRRVLSKITKTELVYLAFDQSTRDAYRARAGAQG